MSVKSFWFLSQKDDSFITAVAAGSDRDNTGISGRVLTCDRFAKSCQASESYKSSLRVEQVTECPHSTVYMNKNSCSLFPDAVMVLKIKTFCLSNQS